MGYTVLNIDNQDINNNRTSTVLGTTFRLNNRQFPPIYSSYEQSRENLLNLLLTIRGERIYHPSFGSNLLRFIFEPITDIIKQRIIDDITVTVNTWLPYITITNLQIETFQDNPALDNDVTISLNWALNEFEGDLIVITSNGQQVTAQ